MDDGQHRENRRGASPESSFRKEVAEASLIRSSKGHVCGELAVLGGCLNRWLLASVQGARRIIHTWLEAYHDERPHSALAGLTPTAFQAPCGGTSQQAA